MVLTSPYAVAQQQRQFEITTGAGKLAIDKKNVVSVKPWPETNGAIIILREYQQESNFALRAIEPYREVLQRMMQG